MRVFLSSLALLCTACATPYEQDQHAERVVRKMSPLIEAAVTGKVRDNFKSDMIRLEKKAESDDDALRGDIEEAFHTSKDQRRDIIADSIRADAMQRDAFDRHVAADNKRYAEARHELSKLAGRVEGADAAIQTNTGVVRGMLLTAAAQLNQTNALARKNEHRHTASDKQKMLDDQAEALWRRQVADEMKAANATDQASWFKDLEADFDSWWKGMVKYAGYIAAIVLALTTVIVIWKKGTKKS